MNFNRNSDCGNDQLPNGNFWQVNWRATANGHSVTEGGSSGSPLFNRASRVVGQLWGAGTCDNSNCDDPNTDRGNYGKIFASWNGANAASRLRDWLDPINNGSQFLNGLSGDYVINGPTNLCPSGSYSVIPSPPLGTTINWSVSPTNAGTFSGTGSSTTFTRSSGFSGTATISAQVVGTGVVTKSINVTGTMNFTWNGVGPFGQVDVSITSGSPPFKIYRGNTLLYSGSSYGPTTVNFGCNGGSLRVEANTPCGTASKTVLIPSGCASFRGQSTMVVYPNPTRSKINVSQNEQLEKTRKNSSLGTVRLELYDFDGNQIKSQDYRNFNGEVQMNVSDIKKATYLLRIVAKEVDEVHQIIKE